MPPSAAAAMDDEHVYVPLQGGELRAFTRETGATLWTKTVSTSRPPVVRNGHVFIATDDAIDALDAKSGDERWQTLIASPLASPMVWDSELLIAADQSGSMLAIRSGDGQIAWRRPIGAPSRYAAVPSGARAVVFSLDDGRVVALTARTGEPLWEQRLPGTLGAPAAAPDRVFVGSTNNFFYALDADSGKIEWKWRTGGDVIGAAADREGGVYIASLDNILRAVNRDNGNQRWKIEVPTRPSIPPIAFGRIVVLTGVAPRLDAYLAKTGSALGSYTAPADLQGAPLIDQNLEPFRVSMVVLTRDGQLVGLRPEKMLLPEPVLAPLPSLPGTRLDPEPRPPGPRYPTPHNGLR